MRTTVDIDDAILERAKRLAEKEKQTLGAVVGQALTSYLGMRRQSAKDPPFDVLAAGSAHGRFPSAAELAAAEEDDDARMLARPGK